MKAKYILKGMTLFVCLLMLPAPVLAQDFCEGNFDYDQDQDGTDAFTFKTDFGRSTFGNPCPPDGPAPVPKTGQTVCSGSDGNPRDCAGTGEDGEFQMGVAWTNPRFTDNGDGTVKDNLTGLIWLKDADCYLFNAPRTWEDALNIIVPQLEDGFCGLTDGSGPGDWRLPNRFELESLLDLGNYDPALPSGHPFVNLPVLSSYWSSTTYEPVTLNAWRVKMYDGVSDPSSKGIDRYVWPVRGGH